MGSVYEAEETTTGRRVAVKVIRAEFADSPDALERFRREGRLAATIQHSRCVFVLGADEEAGRPYIVMELMPGQNLQDSVEATGRLGIPEAIRHILDILEGLEEAHRCGVVHRDVKPSNCFLDSEGRVKVGDFGLAKSLITEQALTRSGAFLGTLLFASPEQIRNDSVDYFTDIYSLCATLYFLLTGRAPFDEGDAASTLARTVTEDAPSMRKSRPELPRTLDKIVLRGLERSRKRRWQSFEELRLALLPFVEPEQCYADMSGRVSAYLIDRVGRLPLEIGVGLALAGVVAVDKATEPGLRMALTMAGSFLLSLLCGLLYYSVPETLWGWSPGKWLMGLRVREAATADYPRWWRSGLRTLWFYLFKDGLPLMAGLVLIGIWSGMRGDREAALTMRVAVISMLLVIVPALMGLAGLGLLASTMRRRNGLRALHEWLSGTTLIRLPERRPRFRAGASTWPKESPLPEGIPRQLGGLRVCALAGQSADGQVFHAQEESLGRPVWLWLRPRDHSPLTARRREIGRPARSRWLAGGVAEDRWFDAVLAAAGQPLLAVVSPRRPLGWVETLTILEQLTEEMLAATHDGTLPERLAPQQVWLQASGQVVLLDVPLAEEGFVRSPIDLLRQVAATALEGSPRATGDLRRPIQAAVPRAASDFLASLGEKGQTLDRVYLALHEVREAPAEISRPLRALQVAANAALVVPGVVCMFSIGPIILFLAVLSSFYGLAKCEFDVAENESLNNLARLDIITLPDVPGKLTAAGRYATGRAENRELWAKFGKLQLQRETVLGGWDLFLSKTLAEFEEEMQDGLFEGPNDLVDQEDLDKRREELGALAFASGFAKPSMIVVPQLLFLLLLWPVTWASWAFLTRGGLVPKLMGIALVDRQGRPAPRWRCFLREVYIWSPVVLLLGGSLLIDVLRLAGGADWDADYLTYAGWLAFGMWWLALLLLPVFAFRSVRGPRRGLHDRLAGLHLVPG